MSLSSAGASCTHFALVGRFPVVITAGRGNAGECIAHLPRCGRPNRRAPQARWCSDSCRMMARKECRGAHEVAPGRTICVYLPRAQGTVNLTVLLPSWDGGIG